MEKTVVLVMCLVALSHLHIQAQEEEEEEEDGSFKTSGEPPDVTNEPSVEARQKRDYYPYYYNYPSPYYSWYPYHYPYPQFQCPPCPSCECCKCGPVCKCFLDQLTGKPICPPCLPPRSCPCTSDDVLERPPRPKPPRWPNYWNYLCAPCPVVTCPPCEDGP